METLLSLFIQHFWILLVATTLFIAWWGWGAVQSRIRKQPDLEEGYRRLFKGFAFWSNVPWLIMGGLILSGKVNSITDFLYPNLGNPYILFWFASLLGLLLLLLFWVFFMKGAETLEKHPGLPLVPHWNARKLRYFFVGFTLWSLVCSAFLILDFNKLVQQHFSFAFFFLFFVGMWIGMSYLFPVIIGWNVLAEHYLSKSDFQGELFRFKSGRIGMAAYGNVLTLGVNPHGFYLATSWLFRIGHPPLLIPWEDITAKLKNRWIFSSAQFEFSKTPGIVLTLSKRLAETIAGASGDRLKIPLN